MANEEQLKRLKQGVDVWNEWRKNDIEAEIDLIGANLVEANLIEANLCWANLRDAKLRNAKLTEADLHDADLTEADLSGANLGWADLICANFIEADLSGADLIEADLSEADLNRANLYRADLSRIRALHTNFTRAVFTGACIEDWNINSQTKLDNIQCEYIYLKRNKQERRPSHPNRNFEPGEFTKLFQKALSTVDLIFRNGVDWQALLISLEKLRVEAAGAELSIQAIENKNDGAFVVRVNTPPEANKAEVEKFLKREYEVALKALDEKYQVQLQAKDREIEIYRQKGADLMEIARLMAGRSIMVSGDYVEGNKAANDLVMGDKVERDKNINDG